MRKTILLFLNEVEFYETCGNFVYAGLPFENYFGLDEFVWNLTLKLWNVCWFLHYYKVMNYLFKKYEGIPLNHLVQYRIYFTSSDFQYNFP